MAKFKPGEPNPGKPFEKGQSGNPGGRPKSVKEVQELAREHTVDSIKALVKNLKDESGTVRNAAATELLNRAWGRAPQVITGEGGEGPLKAEVTIRFVDPDPSHTED